MVTRIISGAQTGADIGGLRAAKQLGIATGGWMPNGFITLDGPRPEYAQEFGLREHRSAKYPPRTEANVKEANATIRFARNFASRGEVCTLKAILKHKKPYLDVDIGSPPSVDEVRAWLLANNVRVLNIAGNPEKLAPGIEAWVCDFMVKVLGNTATVPQATPT